MVTMTLRDALDPASGIGPVRAIQISIPERIQLLTNMGVENMDGLVTPDTGWMHLYGRQRLVRVDIVGSTTEEPPVIPKGSYRFKFKVWLDEFLMAKVNVWFLSICRDLVCTEITSSMPFAGFNLNDP